jgi:hypothetical protein
MQSYNLARFNPQVWQFPTLYMRTTLVLGDTSTKVLFGCPARVSTLVPFDNGTCEDTRDPSATVHVNRKSMKQIVHRAGQRNESLSNEAEAGEGPK